MEEKPRVVISTNLKRETQDKFFTFTSEQIIKDELSDFRKEAWNAYNLIPVPDLEQESWRRSDLIRSLPIGSLQLPYKEVPNRSLPFSAKKNNRFFSGLEGGRVLLTPSYSSQYLAPELERQGVVFSDFQIAQKKNIDIINKLIGRIVPPEDGKFAALTAAFSRNGILIYVPKGVHVSVPLSGILWGMDPGSILISHILIWLDDGSKATIILESTSPSHKIGNMHTSNIEIHVGEDASLQFIDLQTLGDSSWNFNHSRARVERKGNLDWVFGAVGARFSKSFISLDLAGAGARGRMTGFYFPDGTQHLDMDTQQDHHAPNTTSDLLFKGALKGNSRAVWQGMIYVAPEAQKADGYQANRNIILSEGARADSIPGLEILADDVRCTHGATVSRLEDEPKFYLQTRGIPRIEAEQLLVQGFFEPVMDRIPFPTLRRRLSQIIQKKTEK